MIEIQNSNQFYDIVNSFKNSCEKVLTNCFFMPDEVNLLAEQGRLKIKELPEWLLILCKRDDYSNLYYYTTDSSLPDYVKEFLQDSQESDIYLDIVSRMGRGDVSTPQKLIASDCAEKYKTYQRMQLPLKNVDFDTIQVSLPEKYVLSFDYCDHTALSELWKEALDEKSTPLPRKEELLELCEQGNLLTICTDQKELAAVIVFSVTAKQGLLQHLAVSKNHRRKGLAMSLFNACILKAQEENLTTLRLWVDCKNLSAITLYDRFGFTTDGMLCDQLYMKGK